MMRIEGCTAIITGASSGIGQAAAREFVFFGADKGEEEVEFRTQKFKLDVPFGRSLNREIEYLLWEAFRVDVDAFANARNATLPARPPDSRPVRPLRASPTRKGAVRSSRSA